MRLGSRRWGTSFVAAGLLACLVVGGASSAAGPLDPSFGGTGVVQIPQNVSAPALALDSQQRIVIVGAAPICGGLTVNRLLPTGAPDQSFGIAGAVSFKFDFNCLFGQDVAIAPDGGIIVAARGDQTPVIVRLTANGAVDPAFGDDGLVQLPGSGGVEQLVVDGTGRIVILFNGELARLSPSGVVESAYPNVEGAEAFTGIDIALSPAGAVTELGLAGTSRRIAVRRLDASGTPVDTFGTLGTTSQTLVNAPFQAFALAVDGSGRTLVVGGSFSIGDPNTKAAVLRLSTDGAADSSFGSAGLKTVAFAGLNANALAVATTVDDGVVMGGLGTNSSTQLNSRFFVALDSTGSLDLRLGGTGFYQGTDRGAFRDLAIQEDGYVVGVGESLYPASEAARFALDVSAPLLVQANVTEEATSAVGAVVRFAPSAVDDHDPTPLLQNCSPASGSQFPIGLTTVTCAVADASGNYGTGTFLVRVQDTTGPLITSPSAVVIDAESPAGGPASFVVSASDLVDGPVEATCAPPSGSTFVIGDTTVACSALDEFRNIERASFVVHVRGALEQLDALKDVISGFEARRSVIDGLLRDADRARASIVAGKKAQACGDLARVAKPAKLEIQDQAIVTATIRRIQSVVGC